MRRRKKRRKKNGQEIPKTSFRHTILGSEVKLVTLVRLPFAPEVNKYIRSFTSDQIRVHAKQSRPQAILPNPTISTDKAAAAAIAERYY